MTAAPKLESINGVLAHREELAEDDFEFLKTTVLFKDAEEELLQSIAGFFEKQSFEVGEPIILENEIGDHVYFIKSGAVEIVKYIPEVKHIARLILLKKPAHFSEFSVLSKNSKSGSAFAYEPTEILKIKGDAFLHVLRTHPQIAQRLAVYLAGLYMKSNSSKSFVEFYQLRYLRPRKEILQHLPSTLWKKYGVLPLSLDNNVLHVSLLDPFNSTFYEHFKSTTNLTINTCLITQNDYDALFKKLNVNYPPPDSENINREPIVPTYPDLLSLLKSNLLFSHFPPEYLEQLIPHFKTLHFKAGEKVFLNNATADYLYLMESGKISLHRPLPKTSGFTESGQILPGNHFGEAALLANVPQPSVAQATRATVLHALPADTVRHLLASSEFCIRLSQGLAQKIQKRSQRAGINHSIITETLKIEELASLIPFSIINDHKIIPVKIHEKEVTIGTVNANRETIYPLVGRYLLDYRIKLEMISEADYSKWSKEFQNYIKNLNATTTPTPTPGNTAISANTVALLDDLIARGFNDRASDIHFECGEEIMVVRFRIDGVLKEHSEKFPKNLARELMSRIKVMCQMDIANHFIPQDGQLKLKIGDNAILARVSYIPTKNGEKMVLRLIQTKNAIIPYNMLAPDRRLISILREVTQSNQGLFLITGPTGSGKSTTLYSVLNELNRSDANLITLEDPVEMNIAGINQVEVNEKTGMTFAKALRSVLRQDPDVIMVGEVRDEESAQIVFKAAITGHLVLSTLHTNSSLDVTPRLKEMGVPPGTIAAGLLGVLAQRLVRRICKHCIETRPIKTHEIAFLKKHLPHLTQMPEHMSEGRGCTKCKDTGFYDRIPVYEVWRKTPEVKALLTMSAGFEELKKGVKNDGFVSLIECGLQMAVNGLTTVDEVMRCITET
ncbi:MAG: ATPase, T2SS/T4P/T4SS family [Bdellovibrionales bacterium]